MRLFDKFRLCLVLIMLIFTIKTIFLCIELEKEFKKDIRNTKEEILLNHNFDKNEIHFLLDY